MDLTVITRRLDEYFRVQDFPPDIPFSFVVPDVYQRIGVTMRKYFERDFLTSFHGLMVGYSSVIHELYSCVFVSEEILDQLFVMAGRNALLIAHHPVAMETSKRGFLGLSEDYINEIRRRGHSVYVAHTPLDVHREVSTSRALARECGLVNPLEYHRNTVGYSGVYGLLSVPVELDQFIARTATVTGVHNVHYLRRREVIRSLGVVAGGVYIEAVFDTYAVGCDAFLTGCYYNLVDNEIGAECRAAFHRVQKELEISLIECSHYASEAVVMRLDIPKLCRSLLGMPCTFLPQKDPWY